ncbi:MAG: nucleotidyltransferase domain-containing protein [Campylobacterales bacterium]|nr:nucleotidyltransferase domain-containing protein [Campylobacterales bacterium]
MTKEDILNYLSTNKERFKKLYSVNEIGIFGSYARNEATPSSDIDIVVDLKKSTMFGLVAIKADIEEYFKTHVDIVQIRDRMNKLLKQRIEKEAIYV